MARLDRAIHEHRRRSVRMGPRIKSEGDGGKLGKPQPASASRRTFSIPRRI